MSAESTEQSEQSGEITKLLREYEAVRWPGDGSLELENREAEIERFAKQYGFKLRFYKRGLFAIFR